MTDLTAIDILVLPGEPMLERAHSLNEELRQSVPTGFALDDRHRPHITLLQRYVRTADLPTVISAVGSVIAAADAASLELQGVRIAHMQVDALPGLGLAGLVIRPGAGVLDLQRSLIGAVAPSVEAGGTAAAYVTSAEEPEINADTIRYVEHYVPDHSGERYLAHVTLGLARLEDLAVLEGRPFEPFVFHPTGFAIFQLGNNGTAQRELHAWDLTSDA